MNATCWEDREFWPRLSYRNPRLEWGLDAEAALARWLGLELEVEVSSVRRILTRRTPQYHDFDLQGIARARTITRSRLTHTGCDADVVVDATVGMHSTNSLRVVRSMWYGRKVVLVTVRCHDGHPEHFTSWQTTNLSTWHAVNTKILNAAIGNVHWDDQTQLYQSFSLLSRLVA